MSENKELAPYKKAIQAAKEKFIQIAANQTNLDYQKESLFAMQACQRNDKLMETAHNNPSSLMLAVINVATVGLSLNSSTAYAYLVPRDGNVCLDISYRGFIKIATDTGSILWAKADVVYANDTFEYRGPAEKPLHSSNPFNGDRGEMIGVYCIAKTVEGAILTEIMDKDQVAKVREASKSIKSSYSPWNKYPEEMWKKVVIKRASKTWPKTDKLERLATAIEVVNEHDGINFQHEHTQEQYEYYLSCIMPNKNKEIELAVFWNSLENEEKLSIFRRHKSTIERGKKDPEMKRIEELINTGNQMLANMIIMIEESHDDIEIQEALDGLDDMVIQHISESVSAETTNKLAELKIAA